MTAVGPKGSSGLGLKYPVVLRVVAVAKEVYALHGIRERGPVASLWSFGSGALLDLLRLGFRINAVTGSTSLIAFLS